jgi:hypothetical protein
MNSPQAKDLRLRLHVKPPMNDAILRQLTAYVDGELTSAECEAVNRLLAESSEARETLRAIQRDAERLRSLKRESAPVNFAELVVARIRIQSRRARRLAWVPRTVAAAIIIGVGLGTFAIIHELNTPVGSDDMAERGQGHPSVPKVAVHTVRPSNADNQRAVQALKELTDKLPTREQIAQASDELRSAVDSMTETLTAVYGSSRDAIAGLAGGEPASAGEPGYGNPTYLTSPIHPSKAFKTVDLSKMPLFLDLKELESSKLVTRLREDKLHHIDLSCQESWKALERLQGACRANGIKLVIDADVMQRMNKKLPAQYMVYLENVTPELIGKVMATLQTEDKNAEQRKKGDAQFDSIMVLPLDDAGRKRLADSLGVSPSSLLPAKPKRSGPPVIDPSKPLSKETEKALDKLASGQGRGATGKEATAVVLIAIPNRSRVLVSKEVKTHLDSRTGARPENVNVVFLLRPSRG